MSIATRADDGMNHVAFFSSPFVKKRKKKAISDRESAALGTASALSGVESPTREPVFPLAWYMCRLPPAPKPRVLTEHPPTHTHTRRPVPTAQGFLWRPCLVLPARRPLSPLTRARVPGGLWRPRNTRTLSRRADLSSHEASSA